jgi:hypothetical protein
MKEKFIINAYTKEKKRSNNHPKSQANKEMINKETKLVELKDFLGLYMKLLFLIFFFCNNQ